MQQRYNLTDGDDTLNFVMPYWGFYVEDKWQLKPKWTLSAGLRYDLGIQTYSGNRYGNAIVDMNYDGWQLAIPGRAPGLDLHYLPADKNNFAPRVSLAYEPTPGLGASRRLRGLLRPRHHDDRRRAPRRRVRWRAGLRRRLLRQLPLRCARR